MADITFTCPYCSKSLTIDEKGAGMTVKCVDCDNDIVVPMRSEKPQPSPQVRATPPRPASPTPPPPKPQAQAQKYFYAHGETPVGPYSLDELRSLQVNKAINLNTMVCEEGGTTWKPLSAVFAVPHPSAGSRGPAVPPPPVSNPKHITTGSAVLWFLLCMPIGFGLWGQIGKGFVWVVIALISYGFGAIPAMIDYWMSFQAQTTRQLRPWEFFPR